MRAKKSPEVNTNGGIRGLIGRLILYKPDKSQSKKELLSIVVLREKAGNFDFLQGATRTDVVGSWRDVADDGKLIKEYPKEVNVQIDVEFADRQDDAVHKKLLSFFGEYNKRVVGESLLYIRIVPVEASSL